MPMRDRVAHDFPELVAILLRPDLKFVRRESTSKLSGTSCAPVCVVAVRVTHPPCELPWLHLLCAGACGAFL